MLKRTAALVLLATMLSACGGGSTSPSGPAPTPAPTPTPTPAALWSMSGSGDNVFEMPRTVARVKITGDLASRSSNFIVHIAGRLVVNEILGTSSIAVGPHFEGTYLTTGGTVEITHSTGVAWTFTEVR